MRWLAPVALAIALACAGDVVQTATGYRNPELQYRVERPRGPGPEWRRIDVDGAWIAFGREGPQTMSMQSRCDRPVAAAPIMARELLIGVPERKLLHSAPIAVAGRSGWTQTIETPSDGGSVRVKTVTVVIDGCVYDWMLVAAGDFASAEAAFDGWWESFRLDPDGGEETT